MPHKEGTFDHNRPVTELAHLIDDYKCEIKEDDKTHFAEIISLHDLSMDPGQESISAFHEWIENNARNRGAHHHVFNGLLAAQVIDYAGFQILDMETKKPCDIFLTARNTGSNRIPNNKEFLNVDASYLQNSRFLSDKACL